MSPQRATNVVFEVDQFALEQLPIGQQRAHLLHVDTLDMDGAARAVDAHLRYLERDGVTRDGEKGQVYSGERDVEDGRAFLDRGRDDRHQFRFIVSAENGAELFDPRETTRDLMKQMEADLRTKLDWIAVDHHNTRHPHTHIIVRGITDDGKTLNVAGDYIAYGIRERASEIVTRNWAGRPSLRWRNSSSGKWTPTASPGSSGC